jgi:gamma-butyrobetaine dioxygenase
MAATRTMRSLGVLRRVSVQLKGRNIFYQRRGVSAASDTDESIVREIPNKAPLGDLRPYFKHVHPQEHSDPLEDSDAEIDFLHPDYLQYLAGGLKPQDGQVQGVETTSGNAQEKKKENVVRQVGVEVPRVVTSKIRRPGVTSHFVQIGELAPFHAVFLRDSCPCDRCIDPSSKQKNFQTTDIPPHIRARYVKNHKDGSATVGWDNDVPGFGPSHFSHFPKEFFETNSSHTSILEDRFESEKPILWNKAIITSRLVYGHYDAYMNNDAALYQLLRKLYLYGIVLIRNVPESDKSVERIAERIGKLRDTFYGRTWDVKSVPEAKNVAYTEKYLGLHMDLLYMANPPGFQFLHCLKNTAEGGASIFSDSFYAASRLEPSEFNWLSHYHVPYHYRNAGEHYHYRHPVIELKGDPNQRGRIANVNYSPPFQGPLVFPGEEQKRKFNHFMSPFRSFAAQVENEDNLYEYRLQEGECVIFNNRRVLHGRRQFDTSAGERWLRGCYVDTDVFMSRFRVLAQKRADHDLIPVKIPKAKSPMFRRTPNSQEGGESEQAPNSEQASV